MDDDDPITIGRTVGHSVCPRGPWRDDVIGAATLAAWLHPDCPRTAAWREAVDELRRLTHHRRRDGSRTRVDDVISLDAPLDADGLTIADLLAGPADCPATDLASWLARLTPAQARVAWLCAHGWTQDDAAAELGISPSAVWQHARNIRDRLADVTG